MGAVKNDDYEKGVQALKEDQFEDAEQLIGQGLQAIIEEKGGESLEAASAYFRYGSALFYRAQEESDVFGSTLQTAAKEDEAGPSSSAAVGEETTGGEDDNPGNEGKSEGEEEEEEEGPGDDMQLAWENLEVAREIFTTHQSSHTRELAEVHMLLADLASEQESFEVALTDLRKAQTLLQPILKKNDRLLAELHFKASLTLQFLQQPEKALQETASAIRICNAALEDQKKVEGEAGEKEVASLSAVLEELRDREGELKEAVAELQKTKDSLRNAFQQAVGGAAGSGAGGNVIDLGVVGQGKKRIAVDNVVQQNGGQQGLATKPKQKRSLEDLMGGGDSTVGFGAPTGDALQQGLQVKKQTLETKAVPTDAAATLKAEPAKAALPAFLSSKSIDAVYGSKKVEGKATEK